MAPAILSYLGIGGKSSSPIEDNNPVQALPAEWYTSEDIYQLERRAIFSRRWLLITHSARLSNTGDYVRYDAAGNQFVLCRGRDGNINAFHNICRHRAYPVVEKESGCAKIFSCRYHGWSYGLNGKLAKAPGYQELNGFDKTQNGLFPIHVRVDRNGFVWVNFDAQDIPDVAWEDDFEGVDTQERFEQFNPDDYDFDHTIEVDGSYNWKLLADHYNENSHKVTTDINTPTGANLKSDTVRTRGAWIGHDRTLAHDQKDAGSELCSTYFFPNASTNISPHFFFIQKFIPNGPKSSSIRYEIYRNKNSSDQDFQLVNDIYKRVMSEDKAFCERAQQNIDSGVFISDELQPATGKGPLFFQKSVRDAVTSHQQREEAAKQEIWPARQTLPNDANALISQDDIDFCSGLSCSPQKQEQLAW